MASDRSPGGTLTQDEADRLREQIEKEGVSVIAARIGIHAQTLCKAAARVRVHRLTVSTIRASRI